MSSYTWPQGSTRPPWTITCQNGTGAQATAQDLTSNTSIVVTLARTDRLPLVYTAIAGVAAVSGAPANGQVSVKFAAADVATPGAYWVVVTVNFTGPDPWVSLPLPFTITETR